MTLAIAHRGASASAPENTLAAFDLAVELGADMVELDLRMTGDGFLVALHDGTLARTGHPRGYAGGPAPVADLTLDQVRRHDVGSWFNAAFPALARTSFEGLTAPTLAEIFVRCGSKTRLFLELKDPESDPRTVRELVALISDFGLRSHADAGGLKVASFHIPTLRSLQAEAPYLPTVRLVPKEHLRSVVAHLDAVGEMSRGVGLHVANVVDEIVDEVRRAGLELYVWTVNRRAEMQHLIALEVDGIVTDDPQSLRGLLSAPELEPAADPPG